MRRKDGSHPRHRLDRGEIRAEGRELPGQFAGSGSEVDDFDPGSDSETVDHPGDGLGWILRPAPVISVGGRGEALAGHLVNPVGHRWVSNGAMARSYPGCYVLPTDIPVDAQRASRPQPLPSLRP
jgi:hypothetical protein